jgi:hypothetical protein
MRSRTTERFRRAFEHLPEQVQRQARKTYKLFVQDPHHPSIRFKRVHPNRPIYSVRVSLEYRALGVREEDEVIWFWIGSHADYDRLVSRLRELG